MSFPQSFSFNCIFNCFDECNNAVQLNSFISRDCGVNRITSSRWDNYFLGIWIFLRINASKYFDPSEKSEFNCSSYLHMISALSKYHCNPEQQLEHLHPENDSEFYCSFDFHEWINASLFLSAIHMHKILDYKWCQILLS